MNELEAAAMQARRELATLRTPAGGSVPTA
jgi:hypothetical protein